MHAAQRWPTTCGGTRAPPRSRLARDWRFTLSAVVILGLGIGANTAISSAVNAMLVRRSRVADPDRVVEIYQNTRDGR